MMWINRLITILLTQHTSRENKKIAKANGFKNMREMQIAERKKRDLERYRRKPDEELTLGQKVEDGLDEWWHMWND